jgi:hypothetical protein
MQLADHAFIERGHFEHYLLGVLERSVQVWNSQLRLCCQCRWVAYCSRIKVREPLISALMDRLSTDSRPITDFSALLIA